MPNNSESDIPAYEHCSGMDSNKIQRLPAMLEAAPIGTYADSFFGEPEFSVPADARRMHMELFVGTGSRNILQCDNLGLQRCSLKRQVEYEPYLCRG